jgi:uncharacterized protein YciI
MREQEQWPEHADFMEGLVSEGFVVLGGPLGGEERRFLLAVRAEDAEAVRSRLAADPWSEKQILAIAGVEPWTILLGRDSPRPRRSLSSRRRA